MKWLYIISTTAKLQLYTIFLTKQNKKYCFKTPCPSQSGKQARNDKTGSLLDCLPMAWGKQAQNDKMRFRDKYGITLCIMEIPALTPRQRRILRSAGMTVVLLFVNSQWQKTKSKKNLNIVYLVLSIECLNIIIKILDKQNTINDTQVKNNFYPFP